jgi:hypothetical protein
MAWIVAWMGVVAAASSVSEVRPCVRACGSKRAIASIGLINMHSICIFSDHSMLVVPTCPCPLVHASLATQCEQPVRGNAVSCDVMHVHASSTTVLFGSHLAVLMS